MLHLEPEITRLIRQNLFRTLISFDAAQSTLADQNGREVILFCTNNYLGLANHPLLKEAAISAIQTWGIGSGASRLISGNSSIYRALETMLAQWKLSEAALVFNSGYTANLGALSTLIKKEDLVLSDRLNHASLIDGARTAKGTFRVYRHKDMAQLEKLLRARKKGQEAIILTDGVFSMDGDIAPLPEILRLAEEYDATIYLDDAHATGILGPHGGGTCDHFNLSSDRIIQMGTLSKALGGLGGFITGSELLIQYLINKARSFIYTTALPPALVAASLAALKLARDDERLRNQLRHNAAYFRRKVTAIGFSICESETPIVPLQIGNNEKTVLFSRELLKEGIYIPAIRPPTVPAGTARLRVSLMATHTQAQIDLLLARLEKIGKNLRLI